MQRQQVAVDQELESLGPLGGRGREQVGRVHEPVGRGVVLVEPDAVEAQTLERVPRLKVLRVRAHRHLGLEVAPGQWPRQLLALLQMIEVLGVGKQVEDEDVHDGDHSITAE